MYHLKEEQLEFRMNERIFLTTTILTKREFITIIHQFIDNSNTNRMINIALLHNITPSNPLFAFWRPQVPSKIGTYQITIMC